MLVPLHSRTSTIGNYWPGLRFRGFAGRFAGEMLVLESAWCRSSRSNRARNSSIVSSSLSPASGPEPEGGREPSTGGGINNFFSGAIKARGSWYACSRISGMMAPAFKNFVVPPSINLRIISACSGPSLPMDCISVTCARTGKPLMIKSICASMRFSLKKTTRSHKAITNSRICSITLAAPRKSNDLSLPESQESTVKPSPDSSSI